MRRRWFPEPVRRLVSIAFDPEPVGAATVMASFRAANAPGGRTVPMPHAYSGYVQGPVYPFVSLGAGRPVAPIPQAFPGTTSPTGQPIGGSTADLLWRTSGLAGSSS